MGYARAVTYNTVVQIVGRLFTTIVSLATVSVLNSTLQAERWGVYVAITNYLGFFAVFADLGLNLLYLREISREPDKVGQITARFLGFRIFTALLFFGLAPLVALTIPVYQSLHIAIAITAIGQGFLVLNQMFVSVFQARLRMDYAVFTDVIGRVITLAGILAVARMDTQINLEMVLWAVVIGNLVNLIVSMFFARKMIPIKVEFHFKEWPALIRQLLPLTAMAVLGMIHFKADSIMLTILKGPIDVGIYGNAYKIMEVLIVMPALFAGGLFPAMNQAIIKKDRDFTVFIQKAFDLLAFAVVPLMVLVFALSPFLIAILTRENVIEAATALRILSIALLPLFIGSLVALALLAAEKQKQLSIVQLIAVVANIALNLVLIPYFSYYGAAAATATTEILTVIMSVYLLNSYLDVRLHIYKPLLTVGLGLLLGAGIIYASFYIYANWFDAYLSLSRPLAGLYVVMVGGLTFAAYVGIFALLSLLPPAVQERVNGLKGKLKNI